MHLTETCDEGKPHLITHVQTMAAPVADDEATTPAHIALRDKGLLPAVHLVDTGYLDAELLVTTRRDFGIDLAGPARADERWQAREGKGFAAADFDVDWERKEATCPQGARSASWTPARDNRGVPVIKIKFSSADCGPCQRLADCTRDTRARRCLTLRTHEQHTALVGARHRETTAEFAALSAVRAGRGAYGATGHDLAGRAGLRPAPVALCRSSQDPPPACRDRGSDEPGPDDRMARRRRPGHDTAREVPGVDGRSCLTRIRQRYRNCGRATKAGEDQ